ncbi:MAG TPA: ABC transporter ATP-binding protein [Gaiellaceae bacterium]
MDGDRRKAAWRLLGAAIRRQRVGVVGAVLSGLGWQAAAVLAPLMVMEGIDRGILHRNHGQLALWAGLLLGLGLFEALFGGSRHIFAIRNRAHGDAAIRDEIFGHALQLDARYHDRVGAGELMSRSSSDAELVARVLDSLGHSIGYVLTVLAVAVLMLALDWRLALVVLLPLPLVSVAVWHYTTRYRELVTGQQEQIARSATLVEETVSGIRVVKGLGAGRAMIGRYGEVNGRVVDRGLEIATLDARFLPFLEVVPLLCLGVVLWLGGRQAADGTISLGTFVSFNAYVAMIVWPMRVLGQRVVTWQQALAAAERITEVLEVSPALADGRRRRRGGGGEVRFENVRFGYERDEPVLDGLDLEVPAGSSIALVGGTGSGKTTVSALLARLYDVDAGAVLLDGVDVRELRLADLRRAVSIVFEDTFLFTDTVRTNIAYADPSAGDEAVIHAARLAGAHEFVSRLPDGYDTVLGERGFTLSGGQRQRLAIARAIVGDPDVLVLDDATSAVDATKEHAIRSALATVMEGRTTIVIAHRPATIALADRVAVLERGRVVESGTHEELLRRSQRYRRLLALEAATRPVREADQWKGSGGTGRFPQRAPQPGGGEL